MPLVVTVNLVLVAQVPMDTRLSLYLLPLVMSFKYQIFQTKVLEGRKGGRTWCVLSFIQDREGTFVPVTEQCAVLKIIKETSLPTKCIGKFLAYIWQIPRILAYIC